MICITIYKKPEDQFKGFQVLGHADSVDEGADLVCCSVSVLTINLVNSLERFTEDEFEMEQEEESGLIRVQFDAPLSEKADLLMRSYVLGVESIAEGYDIWLKVITKEV
jgi:uncharacterized protein YsxB (DUF464 family)